MREVKPILALHFSRLALVAGDRRRGSEQIQYMTTICPPYSYGNSCSTCFLLECADDLENVNASRACQVVGVKASRSRLLRFKVDQLTSRPKARSPRRANLTRAAVPQRAPLHARPHLHHPGYVLGLVSVRPASCVVNHAVLGVFDLRYAPYTTSDTTKRRERARGERATLPGERLR